MTIADKYLEMKHEEEITEVNREVRNWILTELRGILPLQKDFIFRGQIADLAFSKFCGLRVDIECERVPATEQFTRHIKVFDGQNSLVLQKNFDYDMTDYYDKEQPGKDKTKSTGK